MAASLHNLKMEFVKNYQGTSRTTETSTRYTFVAIVYSLQPLSIATMSSNLEAGLGKYFYPPDFLGWKFY